MAQDVTVSAVWKNILVTQPAQSETVFYCQAETQTVFFAPELTVIQTDLCVALEKIS